MDTYIKDFNSIWEPGLKAVERFDRYTNWVSSAKTSAWYRTIDNNTLKINDIPEIYYKMYNYYLIAKNTFAKVMYTTVHGEIMRYISNALYIQDSYSIFKQFGIHIKNFNDMLIYQDAFKIFNSNFSIDEDFENYSKILFDDGSVIHTNGIRISRNPEKGHAIEIPGVFNAYVLEGNFVPGPEKRASISTYDGSKLFFEDTPEKQNVNIFKIVSSNDEIFFQSFFKSPETESISYIAAKSGVINISCQSFAEQFNLSEHVYPVYPYIADVKHYRVSKKNFTYVRYINNALEEEPKEEPKEEENAWELDNTSVSIAVFVFMFSSVWFFVNDYLTAGV